MIDHFWSVLFTINSILQRKSELLKYKRFIRVQPEAVRVTGKPPMYDVVCINSKNSVVWLSRMASVNLSPELKYWPFNMLFILYVLQVMVPLGSCELVPAMFDPVTKQVYYNPQAQSQVSGAGTSQGLVMTVAQDVKVLATSRKSKSENFGVNLGLGDAPLIGVNYQKAKITETRQESHHQVNIEIKIPGECSEGCREQANKTFDIANNALYGGSKQKQVN